MRRRSNALERSVRRWRTVTATIWRRETVEDAGGGQGVTWQDTGLTEAVSVGLPSPAERQAAEQEGLEVTHIVTLPTGTVVRRGDRLVVDGQPDPIEVLSIPSGTHSASVPARGRSEPWDEPLA